MVSSDFRPPQFSEDIAWLPPWLLPHQDAQTPTQQGLVGLQGNCSERSDVNLFPKVDAMYENCHLFLSGEDNSPIRVTPSSGNLALWRFLDKWRDIVIEASRVSLFILSLLHQLLQFHLHLSSDGTSQHTSSPLHGILQTESHEFNKVMSMHLVPIASNDWEDRDLQNKMNDSAGFVNLFSLTSKSRFFRNSRPQLLTKDDKICGGEHQEKCDANKNNNKRRHQEQIDAQLKNADSKDTIELSIAASEAVTISELVKSDSPSEVLSAEAVLEVALQVKQARNYLFVDGLDNDSGCPTEEVDETNLLSDLDEDTMADAFEDVGLSVTQVVAAPDDLCGSSSAMKHGCSSSTTFSRVLDTPILGNHYGCDNEVQDSEIRAQEVDFDGISRQNKSEDTLAMDSILSKDLPLESLGGALRKKLCGNLPLGLNTSSLEIHLNSQLHQSVQRNSNVIATNQGVNLDVTGGTSFHTRASINSSQVQGSGKAVEEEHEISDLAQDRFRSRWLGGWTGKDVDVSVYMNLNNTKSISKFFIGETSFLSESADVAPDMNSFIEKPEAGSCMASLSSVPFEGLLSKANEGTILSQDFTGCFSLSSADPLCSVVPCSISLDNADVSPAPDKNVVEEEARIGLNPSSNLVLGNLDRVLGFNAQFAHEEEHIISKINVEDSRATIHRHSTSLKAYSMLLPAQNAGSESGRVHGNGSFSLACTFGLLPSEKNVKRFKLSSEKESTKNLLLEPTPAFSAFEDYDKDQEISATGKPITEFEGQKKMSNETANDSAALQEGQKKISNETANDSAALQGYQQEVRRSPLILSNGTCRRRRLQASKMVVSSNSEVNLKGVLRPELSKTKLAISCEDQNKIPSPIQLHPLEDKGPAKKKVRFSEAEVKLQQSGSCQMLRSIYRTRSNTRTSKRLKDSSPRSNLKTREVNKRLKNCCAKDKKIMIFQGLEFLLTGFSSQKERDLELLIRKHGGVVLSEIPSPPNLRGRRRSRCKQQQQLPVVLSPKKDVVTRKLIKSGHEAHGLVLLDMGSSCH